MNCSNNASSLDRLDPEKAIERINLGSKENLNTMDSVQENQNDSNQKNTGQQSSNTDPEIENGCDNNEDTGDILETNSNNDDIAIKIEQDKTSCVGDNPENIETFNERVASAAISYSHVSQDTPRLMSAFATNSMSSFNIDNVLGSNRNDGKRSSQGPETKEAMFQQAINLMDERCVSRDSSRMMAQIDHRYNYTQPMMPQPHYARSNTEVSVVATATRDDVETPLIGVKQYPYGIHRPEYFYIHQRKPAPMEPLPAWKGYYGNVYFNPINIQSAKATPHPPAPEPDLDQCSEKLQDILSRSRRPVRRSKSVNSRRATNTSVTSLSTASNPRSSATSRRSDIKRSQSMMSVKSKTSSFSKSSNISRQMSILDKQSVLSNFNENIEEDIQWIQGMQSTGSLTILQNEIGQQIQRRPVPPYEKEKIYKGAVLRRTQSAKYPKKHTYPELKVSGGECDKPNKNSQALIRARPHFPFFNHNRHFPKGPNNSGIFSSQSSNSFLGSSESLPPLEQLRASLRRMGSSASKDELINMIPTSQRKLPSAELRKNPCVKFSPEFRKPHPPPRNIVVK